MSKRKYYPYFIVLVLVAAVLFIWINNSARLENYIETPQVGDIYILQDENIYAPIRIDRIEGHEIWMLNYIYVFADAVPDREQIIDLEFDPTNHLIYEHSELVKMFEEGKIVEIYRD